MNHFSIGLWRVTKCGFYMTTGYDQLSSWTEKKLQSTSQSQNCSKKGHGHCLVVCCLSDPLQLSESQWNLRWMLSKSVRCTKNCNICSWQHCSKDKAQFFSTTTPDRTLHKQCFKSWVNWATKFCLICHIHLISWKMTTSSSSILTRFCRKNASTTSRRQKILPKSSSNIKA